MSNIIQAANRFRPFSAIDACKSDSLMDKVRRAKNASLVHLDLVSEMGDLLSTERELGYLEALDMIQFWLNCGKNTREGE